ncbi:Phage tail sheath protein [compost metagenome]
MPEISINFKKLAASAIERSQRGIIALILKDETQTSLPKVDEYKSALAVTTTKHTAANVGYITQALAGGASKVIAVSVDPDSTNAVTDAVTALGYRPFNYIALADGSAAEQTALTAYVKEQEAAKKSIKGVAYNVTNPDSQHVINFANVSVTYLDGTKVTGEKYISRIVGILAGLPLIRSATYYPLADLESAEEPADVEAAVNAGKFVLFNDEGTVRVARSVNSLVTLDANTSEDFKKLIIVESLDQIRSDIAQVFKSDYVGKFRNIYPNQLMLLASINGYFAGLAIDGVLDSTYANVADIDTELQRNAWVASGKAAAEDWDDATVRNNPFGSDVFLKASIKVPDAIEDLNFNVELQ